MTKEELLEFLSAENIGVTGVSIEHDISGLVKISVDFVGVYELKKGIIPVDLALPDDLFVID